MYEYIVGAAVIIFIMIAVVIIVTRDRESLSVSQWMPLKEDCSSLIRPPAPVLPPYNKDTKIDCNLRGDRRLRLKNCDFYDTFLPETSCSGCGGCSSCKANTVLYPKESCFQATPSRHQDAVILPPVPDVLTPIYQTTVNKMKMDDVHRFLKNGDLIVSAKSLDVINYLVKKLQYPGGNGYPDFYNVDGPVTVVRRVGTGYYYMIDYPIKYIPKNIENYVNTTPYIDYAIKAWIAGTRLEESCSPVVVFRGE
jgi:hypothetical protein